MLKLTVRGTCRNTQNIYDIASRKGDRYHYYQLIEPQLRASNEPIFEYTCPNISCCKTKLLEDV